MARVRRLYFGITDNAEPEKMKCHCGLLIVELAEAADECRAIARALLFKQPFNLVHSSRFVSRRPLTHWKKAFDPLEESVCG